MLPSAYVGWLFFLDASLFTTWAILAKGRRAFPNQPRLWVYGFIAGSGSVSAYWIAVWAMTKAPIALVATLRETSVLFAVFIGILFLKEKSGTGKLIAALVIVSGVILLRV